MSVQNEPAKPTSVWNSRVTQMTWSCAALAMIFLSLNFFGEPFAIPLFNVMVLSIAVLLRFAKRHPLIRSTYRDWLRTTPWQPDQPLPLGGAMLESQDFILLGIATGLAFQSPAWLMMLVPIAVLALHLVLVETSLSITKIKFESYCLLCAVIGILWLLPNMVLVVIALLALEPIKRRGHRRLLESFPWNHIKNLPTEGRKSPNRGPKHHPKHNLGHYHSIRSDVEVEEPDKTDALVVSALIGSFGLTLGAHLPKLFNLAASSPEMTNLLRGVFVTIPIAFAVMRVVRFKASYRSPIDCFGRIFAGRMILPDHDRVYIIPMLLILVAAVFAVLVPMAPAIGFALGWGLSCWLLITGKPTLREWIYTGQIKFNMPSISDEIQRN